MDSAFSHPILTCAAAAAWERSLLADEEAEWTAMQRAGAAIAHAVREDFREIGGLPDGARLLVLVGKGHNGGDALLAAQAILAALPRAAAEIVPGFGIAALRPLARRSLEALVASAPGRTRVVEGGSLRNGQGTYSVCLDGLFGFQFRPPVAAATAALLEAVNAHPSIRLRAAVDLPSGLGDANRAAVFRADFTYATGIMKTPVVAVENAPWVGRIRYLDLGFFSRASDAPGAADRVLLPSILTPLAGLRPAQTDKRTYGHLLVVGGSASYPGAVLMTVQAALRSGVGLLTACAPASLVPEYAARFPEAMWVGWPESADGGLGRDAIDLIADRMARGTAMVIGPGLGAAPETLAAVCEIVRRGVVPLVLDADALRPEVLTAAGNRPVICTPHAGEMKRIGASPAPNRILVRKGSPTRIEDARTVYHSFFGGPVLARGGSGDLLAGIIGGLLARDAGNLLLAAARGVVWHGRAADLLARERGQVAVQTTQLLDFLQPALNAAP